jgi:hypothetical protein
MYIHEDVHAKYVYATIPNQTNKKLGSYKFSIPKFKIIIQNLSGPSKH